MVPVCSAVVTAEKQADRLGPDGWGDAPAEEAIHQLRSTHPSCGLARGLMGVAGPWGGSAETRAKHQKEPTAKPGETPASRGSDPPPPGARDGVLGRFGPKALAQEPSLRQSTIAAKHQEKGAL